MVGGLRRKRNIPVSPKNNLLSTPRQSKHASTISPMSRALAERTGQAHHLSKVSTLADALEEADDHLNSLSIEDSWKVTTATFGQEHHAYSSNCELMNGEFVSNFATPCKNDAQPILQTNSSKSNSASPILFCDDQRPIGWSTPSPSYSNAEDPLDSMPKGSPTNNIKKISSSTFKEEYNKEAIDMDVLSSAEKRLKLSKQALSSIPEYKYSRWGNPLSKIPLALSALESVYESSVEKVSLELETRISQSDRLAKLANLSGIPLTTNRPFHVQTPSPVIQLDLGYDVMDNLWSHTHELESTLKRSQTLLQSLKDQLCIIRDLETTGSTRTTSNTMKTLFHEPLQKADELTTRLGHLTGQRIIS